MLDIDQHDFLGHDKEFWFYVLNLAGEVRTDFFLLQNSCVQNLPPVGRAKTSPPYLHFGTRPLRKSAIFLLLVKIEIELMEVLFFNLSLELTLAMKISEARVTPGVNWHIQLAQSLDFASSSPSAQICL
jgi:hypothetical protein